MDCSHSTRMYTQKPTHADRRQHKMESGRLDGPMDGWMERHVYTMYVGVRPIHMALGTVWRSTVARAPSAAQGSVGTRDGRGRRTRGRRAFAVATWLQRRAARPYGRSGRRPGIVPRAARDEGCRKRAGERRCLIARHGVLVE
jgi:hypothetical protein